MKRSNEDWLKALRGEDPNRLQALNDLRDALVGRLRGVLFEREKADEVLIEDFVEDSRQATGIAGRVVVLHPWSTIKWVPIS